MPFWDFKCRSCGKIEVDVVGPKCEPELYAPQCCGQPMDTHLGLRAPAVEMFEPFTTQHMSPNCEKITIRSKRELTKYEREFGVRRIDDPTLVSRGGKIEREAPERRRVYSR